jgi:cobalt/nickel transport system permease protein
MRELRVPQVLVSIVGFMYRYLFVLADEALRLLRARAARSGAGAGKSGGSLLWRGGVGRGHGGQPDPARFRTQ